jgi:hypothetical protein
VVVCLSSFSRGQAKKYQDVGTNRRQDISRSFFIFTKDKTLFSVERSQMPDIQTKPMGFTIDRIVAIGLLVWALDRHPYGYYKLLRVIVCVVSGYGAYFSTEI